MDIEIDDLVREIGLQLPPARGRRPATLEVGEPRPLRAEDVVASNGKFPLPTSTPPALQKLRSRHHQLAQLISSGLTDFEVSTALGYSLSRISILKADPTFRELVSCYEKQHQALHFDVQERLIQLGMDSVETLQARLDENPEDFSNKELLEVAEMALDRTGHGKSSTVSVLHGLDADTHALLKAQHESTKQGRVLNLSDGEFIEVTDGGGTRSEATLDTFHEGPGIEVDPHEGPAAHEGASGQGDLEPDRREIPLFEAALHTGAEAEERLDHREGPGLSEEVDELGHTGQLLLFPASAVRGDREE